jgi:hypothetical protein
MFPPRICSFCGCAEIKCGPKTFHRIPPLSLEESYELRNRCPAFQNASPPEQPTPPYAEFYPRLQQTMENPDGTWNCCPTCRNIDSRIKRMQYLSATSHEYLCNLVTADPMLAQLLAVVDMGMAVTQSRPNRRAISFAMGRVVHDSLYNFVVLHHNPIRPNVPITPQRLRGPVRQLYIRNLERNPIYQRYCCLADRPHSQPGLPQAPMNSVKRLVQRAQDNAPVPGAVNNVRAVHALVPTALPTTYVPANAIFNAGTLEANTDFPSRPIPLVVDGNGLPHQPGQVRLFPTFVCCCLMSL